MRDVARRTWLILALAGTLACLVGCQPAKRCYFCVVPATLPDGRPSTEACGQMETWFCRQAGGFTCWPSLRGGWMDGSQRVDEENVGYLVVGPPGLADPLEALIRRQFQQSEPFVISWSAER